MFNLLNIKVKNRGIPEREERLILKIRGERGFSLIELLAVISIIAILSLIVVANYNSFKSRLSLERSAVKLAQDIRRVEEMAMAAKNSDLCGGVVPEGGYGIYFKKKSSQGEQEIKIFADCNNNGRLDLNSEHPKELIENVDLERGININILHSSTLNTLNITFKPPSPDVYFNGDNSSISAASTTIIISPKTDLLEEKEIIVNKAGLIYVK